ncbi:MAG: DUF962 domain-containing protein [Gammaproteobacteria bacterium]|nr:DUF962 domain-containing protein [Gammaproteobacteria bacterium]
MPSHPLASFEAFWPYYLAQHRLRKNRALHYVGTISASLALLYALLSAQWLALLLVPLAGYGPAWAGHFLIEKNRPATFRYPLWSLVADYKMCFLALQGRMVAELSRQLGRGASVQGEAGR